MTDTPQNALDQIADIVVDRLLQSPQLHQVLGRGPAFGPVGEPVPGLPDLPGREELPDLYQRTRMVISGIELTQSVQFYGTGYGDDNSVPIVALKPMAVRVYAVVRRGVMGPDTLSGQRVTGTLILSRWGKEVYRTGPTRAEGARLGALESLVRELWDAEYTGGFSVGGVTSGVGGMVLQRRNGPLNFMVPPWYLRKGRTTATVVLHTQSGATATKDIDFEVLDVPAPKVALVRVNWTDAANVTSSPTDAEMLGTVRLAERMLPFPYFSTTILTAELTKTGNFWMTGAAGQCNAQWNDLLASLRETRFWVQLFQLADIVYGIVPTAANQAPPNTTINSGCGDPDNGVGACLAGLGRSFAHEIGHIYGRRHVAVPGDPENDPDYPRYGGDPRAIGEVGIDLGTSPVDVYYPPGSNDIMAYFDSNSPDNEKWISPYTYRALIDERYRHASVTASAGRFRPVAVMIFRVYRLGEGGHRFELDTVHRVTAPGGLGARGRTHRAADRQDLVTIDFVDGRDRILYTHDAPDIHTFGACGCCDAAGRGRRPAGWTDHAEAMEWPQGDVTRLIVRKGDEVIGELAVGEAPSVSIEVQSTGQSTNTDPIQVLVRASHPRVTPNTVLLYSHDDGLTWQPVSLRLAPEGRVEVPRERLNGGPRCRFRAVATAELQGAEATSDPFELPERGRALHVEIAAPRCADELTVLRAFIDTRGDGMCSPHEVCWRSVRDGELGCGLELAVALSEGLHEITATMPDGRGGTVSAVATVVSGGRFGR